MQQAKWSWSAVYSFVRKRALVLHLCHHYTCFLGAPSGSTESYLCIKAVSLIKAVSIFRGQITLLENPKLIYKRVKKNRFRWGKQGASPSLSPSGMALMHYYPDEQVWLTAQCWGIKTGKCALRAFAVRITETQRFWGAYLRCRLMSACEPPTHILRHVMELFLLPSSWHEVLSKNLKKICIIWKL